MIRATSSAPPAVLPNSDCARLCEVVPCANAFSTQGHRRAPTPAIPSCWSSVLPTHESSSAGNVEVVAENRARFPVGVYLTLKKYRRMSTDKSLVYDVMFDRILVSFVL